VNERQRVNKKRKRRRRQRKTWKKVLSARRRREPKKIQLLFCLGRVHGLKLVGGVSVLE
jgi:hypothetical protein